MSKIHIIHPFEKYGLGLAPFKYIGMEEKVITHHDGSQQPSGTCQYCYNGIRYCYWIKSADGKTFYVGSECVRKTEDRSLMDPAKRALATLKAQQRAENRDSQKDIERARIEVAKPLLLNTAIRNALAVQPHPTDSKHGHLLNYVIWMMDNAAHSGKLRAAREIEKTAKGLSERILREAKVLEALPEKPVAAPAPPAPPVSRHFGTIGQRDIFRVEIIDIFSFKTGWSSKTVVKMITPEGDHAVVFGSVSDPEIEVGTHLQIKATVKKHDDYHGVNQTVLSRVTVHHDKQGAVVASPTLREVA